MHTRVISAVLAISFAFSGTGPGFAETLISSDPKTQTPAVPLNQAQAAASAAQQQVDQMNALQALSGPVQSAAAPVPDFSVIDPDANYNVKMESGQLTVRVPAGAPFIYTRYRIDMNHLSSFTVETRSTVNSRFGSSKTYDSAGDPQAWNDALSTLSDQLKGIQAAQTDAQAVQNLQSVIDGIDQALGGATDPEPPPPASNLPYMQQVLLQQLQAAPGAVDAFNALFPGSIPQSGLQVSGLALQHLSDLVGDPNFRNYYQAAFPGLLPKVASLLKALQVDPAALQEFNVRFSAQIPASGPVQDGPSRGTLFNLAGDPNFKQAEFLAQLKPVSNIPPSQATAQLQAALHADPAALEAFRTLFAYKITQIGEISTIADVANDPNFNLQAFMPVVVRARQLHAAILQQNKSGDFNLMFNEAIPPSASPQAGAVQALFDITGDPSFNQARFLGVLSGAASLVKALQANPKAVSAFNIAFEAQLPLTGNVTDGKARSALFGAAGTTPPFVYNEADFVSQLAAAEPGLQLIAAIQSTPGAQTAFGLLFGARIAVIGDSAVYHDVANAPGFDRNAFIPVLLKAAALHAAIQQAGLAGAFSKIFDGNLPPSAPPDAQGAKALFDLAGTPGFNQAAFLTVLSKANALYAALQADDSARLAMNGKFGTKIGSSGNLTDVQSRATLFNLTGDPAFDQAGFISWLKSTASPQPPAGSTGSALLQALKATAGAEEAFDTLFYPSIKEKGRDAVLSDVASPSGFDKTAFINVLLKARSFYSAMTANSGSLADFTLLFNEPIPSAVPGESPKGLNGNAIQIVFGLTGDPGFNLSVFTGALTKAASLYRKLQTGGSVSAFNQRYGTQVPASGTLLSGPTRTALFDIVQDPLYNESALLASLASPPPPTGPANPATDWIKANQQASPYGLLESYPEDAGAEHQGFTYDEAVAGMLLLKQGDLGGAKQILNFFKSRWQGSGFLTVYNTQDPNGNAVENDRILGPTAWVGLFALQDYASTKDGASLDLALKIGKWALTLPRMDGGVAMGAAGTFWADKFSVENNLDAYALFNSLAKRAVSAADRTLFAAEAAKVKSWLLTSGYNAQAGVFRRGGYLDGNVNALDVNSWAVLVLGPETLKNDFGIDPDALLAKTEQMLAVQANGSFGGNVLTAKGFDFSGADNAAAIGRLGVKWVEGTNHMILAYKMMANYHAERNDFAKVDYYSERANYFSLQNFRSLAPTTGEEEGYYYTDSPGAKVFSDNPFWFASKGPSVAATAWVYFARTDYNPFSD